MPHRRTRGFTLVELLVVIAIIGILIALLLPAVQAAREAARRSQCTNNAKQLALAVHNYHDTNQAFPPGSIRWTAPYTGNSWETQHVSWIARVLPFMEQNAIYDQINFADTRPYDSIPAKPGYLLRKVEIKSVRCPSDDPISRYAEAGPTNYVGCAGASDGVDGGHFSVSGPVFYRGIFLENSKHTMGSVRDGTSNTMMIGECLVGYPYICRGSCNGGNWPQTACYTGTDGITLTGDEEEGRGYGWFNGYGGQR